MRLVPPDHRLVTRAVRWFDHPEVRQWLGGPDWLPRQLAIVPGGWFHGAWVASCHSWFGLVNDQPVGFVGGEVYEYEKLRVMGLAFIVDPTRWRMGHGRRLLEAVVALPDLAGVDEFFCGVELDNSASRRCCVAAGFRPDERPDKEGFLYHRRRRQPPRPEGISPSTSRAP
jgi:RimJ/RimL family protein N-acetyltransferase